MDSSYLTKVEKRAIMKYAGRIQYTEPEMMGPLFDPINWFLPYTFKVLNRWIRYYDRFEPWIGNAIDMHAEVPLSRFTLTGIEDPEVQKSAADVLVKIGKPAVSRLIAALKHKSDTIRMASATLLGRIGDKRAVHPLVEALTDWKIRHSAAMALDSLGWKPVIPSNRVHYLYARGQKNELLNEWELTNKTLSDDLRSGKKKLIQYAVYTFIDLKGDYIIPELIKILDSTGDVFIAKVYLDSGHQELMEFAKRWADRHEFNAASETNNVGLKGREGDRTSQ